MSLYITDYFLSAFTIPLASDSAIVDAFPHYSAASARRSDHETAGTAGIAEARDTSAPSAALPTSSFSTTMTRLCRRVSDDRRAWQRIGCVTYSVWSPFYARLLRTPRLYHCIGSLIDGLFNSAEFAILTARMWLMPHALVLCTRRDSGGTRAWRVVLF